MKTLKKNNKGFSLVELIVVILIMAIIAVALAPQVMKWVDQSKVSTDNNNKATMKSAIDAAVADYMHQEGNLTTDYAYRISEGSLVGVTGETGAIDADVDNPDTLGDYIGAVLNKQYPGVKQDEDDGYFLVKINSYGSVTVETAGFSGSDNPSGT